MMSYCSTRYDGTSTRQLVTHGHFLVNGQRVDVPSYRVEQYDIITVPKQSNELFPFELARATFGDRPISALDQGRPGIADDPDPLAPDAPADRFAGRRAADRRVLLEVNAGSAQWAMTGFAALETQALASRRLAPPTWSVGLPARGTAA